MSLSRDLKKLLLASSTARSSVVIFLKWEDLCLNVEVHFRGLAWNTGVLGALLRNPETVSPGLEGPTH